MNEVCDQPNFEKVNFVENSPQTKNHFLMSPDFFQFSFLHTVTDSISVPHVILKMADREIGYITVIWKHIESLYKPYKPTKELLETLENRDDVKKVLDRGIIRGKNL